MYSLFFEQKMFKIVDDYPITDEGGNEVYRVKQQFKMFGFHIDVYYPNGALCFSIDRKIVAFLPKFFVTFSNGAQLTLQGKLSFFGQRIDVEGDQIPINLEGNFLNYNFDIYAGSSLIGQVHQAFSFRDKFELQIHDPSYQDLVVALAIAVDQIKDSASKSRSRDKD